MKGFDLHNPVTVHEAVSLLDARDVRNRRARVLAGGQDLLTEIKENIVQPEMLVNLKGIPGLNGISFNERSGLHIGTLATVDALAQNGIVRSRFPALAMAAESVGSPQIRHVGTVGGNLCQRPRCWYYRNEHIICLKKGGDRCYAASGENKYNAILGGGPSYIVHPSDLAVALCALDAMVSIAGPRGARTLPIGRFFVLPAVDVHHENVLKPNEIVTSVSLGHTALADGSVYHKFKEKESMDWALSSAAVALAVEHGVVREARIVLGGVAPIPWRAEAAERELVGKPLSERVIQRSAQAAIHGAAPLEHNAYKVPL
ncbi:MAG TPA: xanthine dehydrogenase family protein subunit M, partial [Chthonomonadales bacterium]|nr:xanthine dehydrogenase family protein subunit M [Chthonomonadales bacterium]